LSGGHWCLYVWEAVRGLSPPNARRLFFQRMHIHNPNTSHNPGSSAQLNCVPLDPTQDLHPMRQENAVQADWIRKGTHLHTDKSARNGRVVVAARSAPAIRFARSSTWGLPAHTLCRIPIFAGELSILRPLLPSARTTTRQVKAVRSKLNWPEQYIAAGILHVAMRIGETRSSANYSLTLRRTAGPTGLQGNEVDAETNRTAGGVTLDMFFLLPLPSPTAPSQVEVQGSIKC
jgi:hypothetical protein